MALEGVETARQLGTVRLEPFVEFSKWLGAQAVQPTLRIATDLDETRLAQHLEVSRHARLMDTDRIDEFRDRTLAVPHHIEDPTTSRLGDHMQDVEVTGHPQSIHIDTYM